VSGTQIGPETIDAIDLAVNALARDWQEPVDAGRHELWLLACLRSTIDYQITDLIASIPPGQRDWNQILNALGHSMADPDLPRHREQIESDIADLTRPPAPDEFDTNPF
jgi:hypothetical protein